MPLPIGSRLGPYEITAPIGAGGMGEVYRATDTNLRRQVAIKVLPPSVAADPERLARFGREAEVLAALNHPNIAAIYGFERQQESASGERLPVSSVALVMELVEGEDLSTLIARGPVSLSDSLPIARQIAEALEAAHEQGIVHRDLKPANVKVRADGTVKVLDFGLAKAMASAGGASSSTGDVANSPTITSPAMTQMGMILGTAAYMAPEQARGRVVDKRADIWAFGAVLFEMLTGTRAFPGDDLTETLAAVVKSDPEWTRLGPAVPAHVQQALRLCLQKDPKQRVGDIRDVRLALDGAFETTIPHANVPAPGARGRLAAALSAMLAVAVVAFIVVLVLWAPWRSAPAAAPETRLDIVTPVTDDPTSFALSPDGRQIVFVASGDGVPRLWLRPLSATTAQPLAGTEGAQYPFWSPDSRSLGFFTVAALKRLDLAGGAPRILAPVSAARGGAWNAEGVILFAPNPRSGLMRVAASGGPTVAVTTLGPRQTGHRFPWFAPDGQRFLFSANGPSETAGIYLGALDGKAPTRLTAADGTGAYLTAGPGPAGALGKDGWLLWVRGSALVAQQLDVVRATLAGEPVTLADGVLVGFQQRSAVSASATGTVAYRTGEGGQRQLTWIDRAGAARGAVGEPDLSALSGPRVSPDGRRVVVSRTVQGNQDLWLIDGTRTSRFTFDTANEAFPLWSPDGTRIVFRSERTGLGDLYQKLASGAGVEERLVASDAVTTATSWSIDDVLLYHRTDARTDTDLWILSMAGDARTSSEFLRTPFREGWGAFSPDGRWVAYMSLESSRMEIYVRPFVAPRAAGSALRPGPVQAGAATGGQWQVSAAGGTYPTWRADGKELYYLNPAGAMMAVPITIAGTTLEPGAPVVLFPTRILGGGGDNRQGRQYDVARDGRFLINTVLDSTVAPITLLQNWQPAAIEAK